MGDEPRYACDQGYALVNGSDADRLVCTSGGNYTGGQPSCVRVECPKPASVPNADIDAPGNNMGDVVRYTCRPGYRITPGHQSELRCTADGTWSADAPVCELIVCPELDAEAGVLVKSWTGGRSVNASVEYMCVQGMTLESGSTTARRTCLPNGTWSGTTPVCSRPACPDPRILYGFVASTSGDAMMTTVLGGGGSGIGQGRRATRVTAGMTAEFDCETGFRLNGSRTLKCLDNVTWSGELPTCVRISCPKPSIANSKIIAPRGFQYGFRILISCDDGYQLEGSVEANCMETGNWSHEMPKCRSADDLKQVYENIV